MGERLSNGRNLRALFAAVPLGVVICLAVVIVIAGLAAVLDQSGTSDPVGVFGFVMLVGVIAFPLAFIGGCLFGLPVASWLERHILALWVPGFAAVWGAFCGWVVSSLFWALVSGWHFDMRMQPTAAMFGSPFGVSVGLCWCYLRRRLEDEQTLPCD